MFEEWDFADVTISLLLGGRHCNFHCDHCLYGCGPEYPYETFSDEALHKVGQMIDRLNEQSIYPALNLVGGEPTANMAEFERVLRYVTRLGCELEMTTNGWWAAKPETTREFFRIVSPYIHGPYSKDSEFRIRVSNDQFHDEHRPAWLRGDGLKRYLDGLFESDEEGVFYEIRYYCPVCDEYVDEPECPHDFSDHATWEEDDDGTWWCEDCQETVGPDHTDPHDVEYESEEIFPIPPTPDPFDPWIYVQGGQHGTDWVIPNGRGVNIGRNGKGCTYYSNVDSLNFMPDGQLIDICCKGSECYFGTLDDHPLVLLELGKRFVDEAKPDCWSCADKAELWAEENLERVKAELVAELEKGEDE